MVTDEQNALRRLLDKDSIVDLVHRYSYCVDHRLYDEVVDLFTEDCTVDYGPDWPPVRTRAALRQMFGHPAGGFKATSHHNANVLVTFEDDDRATVRTSVYAWHEASGCGLARCPDRSRYGAARSRSAGRSPLFGGSYADNSPGRLKR
jgi:SnoaL-like domain